MPLNFWNRPRPFFVPKSPMQFPKAQLFTLLGSQKSNKRVRFPGVFKAQQKCPNEESLSQRHGLPRQTGDPGLNYQSCPKGDGPSVSAVVGVHSHFQKGCLECQGPSPSVLGSGFSSTHSPALVGGSPVAKVIQGRAACLCPSASFSTPPDSGLTHTPAFCPACPFYPSSLFLLSCSCVLSVAASCSSSPPEPSPLFTFTP